MSTIMEMLQRMTSPPHAPQATPVEISPSETTHMHEITPTSRHLIPTNWESVMNEKVEEVIAQRKSRGRFPMTLQKDAREWFDMLSPRSISSFAYFVNKFAIHFSSSAQKKKTAMGLMQVTQDKGETLREYMSRFNRATLGIKNLQMPSVITALLSGFRNHGFRASLSKKPPESMIELLR
ncbi:Uncharacterized protein Adt_27458 [Abeliophyllum distichum]|uniref:Retrotransposon gag domain-containing protein n=1 Tax=Abeliophyllum distichum TaxID=126358 RepID=A0ABD1RTT3_9LAMI